MNVGIYFNKNYFAENRATVRRIQCQLSQKGIQSKVIDSFSDLDGVDVLVVLGGDGTILMVASECAKRKIKIIGINYGHLGFLTEFEPEKADEAVELLCSGRFSIRKRSMLEVEFEKNSYLALNDIVIQRSTSGNYFSNTISLRAEIDGSTVDNFSSDGIIISTPTGSTAYSLSAGGSILTPDINAFIMTPICAHSLHSRPVVYNDDSVLKITSLSAGTLLNLIVDGKFVNVIQGEKTLTLRKSENYVDFITREENNFFNKLLIKLNIWSK